MKYIVTIDAGDGAFGLDYRGPSEEAVRALAEQNWPESAITGIEPA